MATNEVLYHRPARRALQDVLTCIREHNTRDVGKRLEANAERYLKSCGRNGSGLFRDVPEAIAKRRDF